MENKLYKFGLKVIGIALVVCIVVLALWGAIYSVLKNEAKDKIYVAQMLLQSEMPRECQDSSACDEGLYMYDVKFIFDSHIFRPHKHLAHITLIKPYWDRHIKALEGAAYHYSHGNHLKLSTRDKLAQVGEIIGSVEYRVDYLFAPLAYKIIKYAAFGIFGGVCVLIFALFSARIQAFNEAYPRNQTLSAPPPSLLKAALSKGESLSHNKWDFYYSPWYISILAGISGVSYYRGYL